MARRRRRSGASARIRANQGWAVSQQFNNVVTSALSPIEFVLLQDEDWVTQDAAAQRGTLKTVRGNMYATVSAIVSGSQTAALSAAIYLVDEDTPVADPITAGFYQEEDLLWQHMFGWTDSLAANMQPGFDIDIHVKTKRRIRKGQELRMALSLVQLIPPGPTLNVVTGWNLRMLVQRN